MSSHTAEEPSGHPDTALPLSIPTPPRRVKVYNLTDDEWTDWGTGFCQGEIVSDTDGAVAYLTVRDEQNAAHVLLHAKVVGDTHFQKQNKTLILWTDEDKNDMALSFQEAEGCALVIDFLVYCQSSDIARNITVLSISTNSEGCESDSPEIIAGPLQLPPNPPQLRDSSLPRSVDILYATMQTRFGRDGLIKFVEDTHYVAALCRVFAEAEDAHALDDLHALCKITKLLFLINDSAIFGQLLHEDYILPVVGMLEYDPDYPRLKANHREYLQDDTRFNEVVPLDDELVRKKIKQTFRLQFLKDVVLARLLDDPTFSILSNMIFINQMEITEYFRESHDFKTALFGMYWDASYVPAASAKKHAISTADAAPHSPPQPKRHMADSPEPGPGDPGDGASDAASDAASDTAQPASADSSADGSAPLDLLSPSSLPDIRVKRDGVRFVHQLVITAKSFPLPLKMQAFKRLMDAGLFDLIDFAMHDTHLPMHTLATELLVTIIDNDGGGIVRNCDVARSLQIIRSLSALLASDDDFGIKCQATEALKVVLDPEIRRDYRQRINLNEVSYEEITSELLLAEATNNNNAKAYDRKFVEAFYEHCAPKLFAPLVAISQSPQSLPPRLTIAERTYYEQLLNILSFVILRHWDNSFEYIVQNKLSTAVSLLMASKSKQVQLAAVKCLTAMLMYEYNDRYVSEIIKYSLLGSLLNVVKKSSSSNNLIVSACLRALDHIHQNAQPFLNSGMLVLLKHLETNYKDELTQFKNYSVVGQLLEKMKLVDDVHDPLTDDDAEVEYMTDTDALNGSDQLMDLEDEQSSLVDQTKHSATISDRLLGDDSTSLSSVRSKTGSLKRTLTSASRRLFKKKPKNEGEKV